VANPQIAQGKLNRLRASITWNDFPALNVIPGFLNRAGISISFDGEAAKFFPTMTGAVTSNEPFQMVTLRIALLKTQSLAQIYENQKKLDAVIGAGTVRPDVSDGIGPIDVLNCAIENVAELSFAGEDPGYTVMVRGYTLINSALWP
jgi:hypothetical protein